jgi:hypothetical protein
VSIISGYDPINDHYVVSLKNGFIEWREDEYSCEGGLTEWREDTYTCQQESDPTTTTTTAAPTTSTTTVATTTTDAPTTSTTTAATTTTQAPDPTTTTTTSGGGGTTTTTSTTIPTTPPPTSTTITPVYYSLERCSDGSVGFRTGQQIGDISLSVNDRVEVSSLFYIVTGTTTSGTSVGTVTDTGLTGCPIVTTSTTSTSTTTSSTTTTSTTIPTTPPPTTTSTTIVSYNYYAVRGCPGSFYENRDMYIRTTSTLTDANGNPSTSSSISWNGQSFYAYSTISESAWTSGSGDLASITYTGSVGTGCPVATTTTAAPTTSAPTTQPPATTTTQPPATTTTQPITTQAPTTTTVAPTTAAPTTTTTIPTTTTTNVATTTTAAPNNSWIAERFDGLVYAYVWLQQGYQINDLVTLNDGSGQCWTLGDQTTADGQYNITGTCPPPTTQPPTTTSTTIVTTTTKAPAPTTTTTRS